MKGKDMCQIPLKVTYRIENGEPVRVNTEWADIPSDAIARFLLQRCGVDVIFGEEGEKG